MNPQHTHNIYVRHDGQDIKTLKNTYFEYFWYAVSRKYLMWELHTVRQVCLHDYMIEVSQSVFQLPARGIIYFIKFCNNQSMFLMNIVYICCYNLRHYFKWMKAVTCFHLQ